MASHVRGLIAVPHSERQNARSPRGRGCAGFFSEFASGESDRGERLEIYLKYQELGKRFFHESGPE